MRNTDAGMCRRRKRQSPSPPLTFPAKSGLDLDRDTRSLSCAFANGPKRFIVVIASLGGLALKWSVPSPVVGLAIAALFVLACEAEPGNTSSNASDGRGPSITAAQVQDFLSHSAGLADASQAETSALEATAGAGEITGFALDGGATGTTSVSTESPYVRAHLTRKAEPPFGPVIMPLLAGEASDRAQLLNPVRTCV